MPASPLMLFLTTTTPLSVIVAAPPPQDPLPPITENRSYSFGVEQDGKPAMDDAEQPPGEASMANNDEAHSIGPHECETVGDNVQACTAVRQERNGAEASPAELALRKWARLPIPVPTVRTAPPRRSAGLVGLPEWFWVTNWQPLSGRVTAGDAWAEVNAVPQRMKIEPGNGATIRCSGPGTAYDKSKPAVSQRTDCSYTYARSSATQLGEAYRVRVTVVWGGTWRGSGGTGGVLPPLSRSTTFQLRIAEAQGLYG